MGYATPLTRYLQPHTVIEAPDTHDKLPLEYHNKCITHLSWKDDLKIWNVVAHTFVNDYFAINPGVLMEHGRVCQEHFHAFIDYLAFRPTSNCSCHHQTAFLYLLCELCATPMLYENLLEQNNLSINANFNLKPFNITTFHTDGANIVDLAKWLTNGGFSIGKAAKMFHWCHLVIHNKVTLWSEYINLPSAEPNWFRLEKDVRVAACSHPSTAKGQSYYYPPHPDPTRQFATGFASPNEMDPPDAIFEYCFKYKIDPSNLTEETFIQLTEMMESEADLASQTILVNTDAPAKLANPLSLQEWLGLKSVDDVLPDLKFKKAVKGTVST